MCKYNEQDIQDSYDDGFKDGVEMERDRWEHILEQAKKMLDVD